MPKSFESLESHETPRTIGLFSGTMMCVGMVIGSGIFSVPATILGLVGSMGMVLVVFAMGALVAFCGACAYVELGCMRPVSGGDKDYLDYAFRKPKALFSFMFTQMMVWVVRPGFCAADAVAFGENVLYALIGTKEQLQVAGKQQLADTYDWMAKALGVLCIISITLMHGYTPRLGIIVQDSLTVVKMSVLVLVIVIGIVAATGTTSLPKANNFEGDLFANTSADFSQIATALFAGFFAYDGFNNLNYSLDELKDPIKNLPRATFLAVAITSFLDIFATLSYFVVVPIAAMDPESTLLAAQYFTMTLGETFGAKIIPVLIGFASFGCVMCMTFGISRVTRSAAKEGYLPFASFLSHTNGQDAPFGALILHLILTLVLILATPSGNAYQFLLSLTGYPEWFFYGLSVFGLLYMRFSRPNEKRPFKSLWITNIIFLTVTLALAIFPFIPPSEQDPSKYPYYLPALIGALSILLCVPWWYFQIGKKQSRKESWMDEETDYSPLSHVSHHFEDKKMDIK